MTSLKQQDKGHGRANVEARKPEHRPQAGAGGKLGIGKLIAMLVLLGVVAGAALALLNNNGSSPPPLPTFPASNSSLPTAYQAMLAQGGDQMANLESMTNAQLANLTHAGQGTGGGINISYTGAVYAKPSGAVGLALGTVSSPVNAYVALFGDQHRADGTVESASVAGSLNMQYVGDANGTSYVCANFNATAASYGSVGAILSKTPQCRQGSDIAGMNLASLTFFRFSQLANVGVNLVYGSARQSSYQGVPCTLINGTLSGTAGTGTYELCMSDSYYVPLSISMRLDGQYGTFVVILNESSVSTTQPQGMAQLPYPLQ